MKKQDRELLKHKTSQLYSLCSKLYPKEFQDMFTASREEFRDWLNSKTGLDVNHITQKIVAIESWIEALEFISNNGAQSRC